MIRYRRFSIQISIAREGLQTGAAYSKIDHAGDLYTIENIVTFPVPAERLITPNTLFDILAIIITV